MNVISIMSPATGESSVSAIEVTSENAGEITNTNGEPVLLGQEDSEDFAQFLLELAEQEPLPIETPDLPVAAPSVIEFETSQVSKRIQNIIGTNDNEASRELANAAKLFGNGLVSTPEAKASGAAAPNEANAAQNVLLTVAYAQVPASALSSNVEIAANITTSAEAVDLDPAVAKAQINTARTNAQLQAQAVQAQNAAPLTVAAAAVSSTPASDAALANAQNAPAHIPAITNDLGQIALGMPRRLENAIKDAGQHEQPIKQPLVTTALAEGDLDIDLSEPSDATSELGPIALRNSILFGDDDAGVSLRPANQTQDADPAAQLIDIDAPETVRAVMSAPAYHMDGEDKHIAPSPFSDPEQQEIKAAAPMPQMSSAALEIHAAQASVHSAVHHSVAAPGHALQISQAGFADLGNSIVQAAKTQKGVSVRLDPPELGRVFIDFQFDAHRNVTAIIRPEFADTSQLLQDQSAWLIQTLSNSGFDKVSLQFADAGQHNFGFEQGANQQQQQGTPYQQDIELETADAAPLHFIKSTSPLHYVRSDAPLNLKL